MNTDHFKLMRTALETEEQSTHETHKVGALLCTDDGKQISSPNFFPPLLEKYIGRDKKLGNASTTIHAEMAVICASKFTQGASIYITDLPCPNCAKLIAEARISAVYIDSHTHNTPLGLKIKPYFDEISKLIFERAGIATYEMNEPDKTINEIISPPTDNMLKPIYRPVSQLSLSNGDVNQSRFLEIIKSQDNNRVFAACYARSDLGQYVFLSAMAARPIGFSSEDAGKIKGLQCKYEPTLQPINRLIVACARFGLRIDPDYLYSSQTPTSREFVNMIGAGYTKIQIENRDKCRDNYGLKALEQVTSHKIIEI